MIKARKKEKRISFYEDNPIFEKIEILKNIYNLNSNSSLVEHLVNLEMKRHGLEKGD